MEEKELLDTLKNMKKEVESAGLEIYPLKSVFLDLARFEYDGKFSDFLNIAKKLDVKILYVQKYKDLENPDKVVGFNFIFKAGTGEVTFHSFDVGETWLGEKENEEAKVTPESMKKELTEIVVQLAKEQGLSAHWELTSAQFARQITEKCGKEFEPFRLEQFIEDLEGAPEVIKIIEENRKRKEEKKKELANELVETKEEYRFAKKSIQKDIIVREFLESKGVNPDERMLVYSVRSYADRLIAKEEMQAPTLTKKAAERIATMKGGDRISLADMARELGAVSNNLAILLKANGTAWGVDVVKEKNKLIVVKIQSRLP